MIVIKTVKVKVINGIKIFLIYAVKILVSVNINTTVCFSMYVRDVCALA